MHECRNAIKYLGARKPKCNAGEGCDLCNLKWDIQEIDRKLERPLFDLAGVNYLTTLTLFNELRHVSFIEEKHLAVTPMRISSDSKAWDLPSRKKTRCDTCTTPCAGPCNERGEYK